MKRMKKVLITGASGFIGRSLAARLLEMNYTVYGVDVFDEGMKTLKENSHFIAIKVDRNHFDAMDSYHIPYLDTVYHLGWAGQLGGQDLNDYSLQIGNVDMTEKLLKKLLGIGMRKFIFCGSISHYKMIRENPDVNSDVYGLAKMFAGKLSMNIAARHQVDGNIALLANTFGIGDYSNKAVNTLIRNFQSGKKLSLIEGETLNDWVYIDDTVRGLIAIGEKGKSYKEYYIGHRIIPTFRNNIEIMKEALNSELDLPFGTYHDTTVADYSKVNLNALYEDTGFECEYELRKAIQETKKWLTAEDKGEEE